LRTKVSALTKRIIKTIARDTSRKKIAIRVWHGKIIK
jgi:hypothetical protein